MVAGVCQLAMLRAQLGKREECWCLAGCLLHSPPLSVLSSTPVHGMVLSTLETPSETSQRCCRSRHHKHIRPTSPLQLLLSILSLCLPCPCDHSQMESLVALSTLLCDQHHHSSSGVLSFFSQLSLQPTFFFSSFLFSGGGD